MQESSHYNKNNKFLSRELRTNGTPGEAILWSRVLRAKGTGYQFNRQFSLKSEELNIIVDFICRKLKLIIEVDGSSHNTKGLKDLERDKKLKELGYYVLRVQEADVRHNIDDVVKQIEDVILLLESDK